MIAYKKDKPWSPFLRPFPFPNTISRQTACALEGTLATGQKYLLVTCYLPHDHAEHAATCISLSTLTNIYPDHIIILGGDFQGDLTSDSDKACHLRTLPFTLFKGPHLPTYTPPHHPTQATCIDHFLYYHPLHNNIQTQDIHNISHAFLDHEGVKAKIHLPLKHHIQPPTPNNAHDNPSTQPIKFHFPIPQPLLAQWKEDMISITNILTPNIQTNLKTLQNTLHTPVPTAGVIRPEVDNTTRMQIIAAADAIQDILAEGLSIATQKFPTKAPYSRPTHKQRSKLWPKTVKRDITTLRNRSVLLRHLLSTYNTITHPPVTPPQTPTPTREETAHIVTILSNAPTLETKLHKPLRTNITLCLPPSTEDQPELDSDIIHKCYKEHRVATRLTIRHANHLRYANYGAALLYQCS